MADADKNIVITPNIGQTTEPNIVFTGQDGNDITLTVLNDGGLSISGTSGQLFSVIDSSAGTIFSVNDISGVPSIEVDDDGTIRLAEFAGNVLLGTATDNGTDLLQVDGSISASSMSATTFTGALSGNASTASTLQTARTISLGGVLSGSASFNGGSNITITASHTSDPTITLTGAVTGSGTMTNLGNVSIATTATADPTLTLTGDVTGSATFTNLGNATLTATVVNDSHSHSNYITSNANDTATGIITFQNSNDYQIALNGNGTSWAGIFWADVGGNDYMWYNGANSTFAIGGGGSNVAGKKLHVHGGLSVGSSVAATSTPTNGIYSEGAISVGGNTVFHDGYHPNADKWTTARTLTLTGAVTGSVSIDGSGNVSLATTATSDPTLTLTGDVTGSATFTNLGNATLTATVANDSHSHSNYVVKTGDTVTGRIIIADAGSIVFDQTAGAGGGGYIPRPSGAYYNTTTSTVTGAIQIRFPAGAAPSDMLSFHVDVFDYAGSSEGESFTAYIYGYNRGTGASWINTGAVITSDRTDRDFQVRFGRDASYTYVWIGETNSTWSYPQIILRDFQVGYTADINQFDDGWNIGFATSFATVDITSVSNYPVSKYAYDADMVDGLQVHTGTNNVANRIVRTDGNGYIQAGWINTTSGATTATLTRIYASNDGYIRYVTPATLASQLNANSLIIYNSAGTALKTIKGLI